MVGVESNNLRRRLYFHRPPRQASVAAYALLIVFFIALCNMILLHESYLNHHSVFLDHDNTGGDLSDFDDEEDQENLGNTLPSKEGNNKKISIPSRPTLGRLNCNEYGPFNQTVVDDLVYWYDIPSDATYLNPFQKRNVDRGVEQYLLFEQDAAGFNNRRMSIETLITMGISMGRTIVLPPEQPIYMFQHRRAKQKYRFSFEDFFHLNEAHLEHTGVNIITMTEFLKRVMEQHLIRDKVTGLPTFPPDNRTNWNNATGKELGKLHSWVEAHSYSVTGWETNECIAYWPNTTDLDEFTWKRIQTLINRTTWPRLNSYDDAPVPVNASVEARFGEQRSNRRIACLYNSTMQSAQVLYFKHTFNRSGNRFLSPFYTFHFYDDWYEALWMRRFVRDHLRYHNELMCAAARVIDAIRERVRRRNIPNHTNDSFHTMHIRRGDFVLQYKDVVVGAEMISDVAKDILEPNSTVFIATDEKNRSYFDPLTKHYDICFLDNFADQLKNVNVNYFGIIDQIIASKGDIFIGTWFSTLSAYVNRLRGYYSVRDKLAGHEKGEINSFYFSPPYKRNRMRKYFAPQGPLWAQEFPMAWRDIDHGIIPDLLPS